jgi:glycosyltransferase involved in cell wall biosynthesis
MPWSTSAGGGVNTVFRAVRTSWARAGVESTVLVDDWGVKRPRLERDEWHLRLNVLSGLPGSPFRALRAAVPAMIRTVRIAMFFRRESITAVHVHYPRLSALGLALSRRSRLWRGALVLTFHGSDVRPPRDGLEAWAWRIIFANCSRVTAVSAALAQKVASTFGMPESDIRVIFNGVDTTVFHPATGNACETLDPPNGSRLIVSVGGYIRRKGHSFLLQAFARLASMDRSLHLTIAGAGGTELAILQDLVQTLGLGTRVTLLVDLKPPEVARLLRRAHLLVQPSLDEPFGLAVIEGAASGIPVAVSAVGGHLEIIRDGENGWTFAPGDVDACERAMQDAFRSAGETRVRAQRLHGEVLRRFTWERCAAEYLELLRSMDA